jgi:hypothetical protein
MTATKKKKKDVKIKPSSKTELHRKESLPPEEELAVEETIYF